MGSTSKSCAADCKNRSVYRAFGAVSAQECVKKLNDLKDERENAVVMCDGDAEHVLDAASFGDFLPEIVNLPRAAAFSLVWKYPPAVFFSKDSFCLKDATLDEKVRLSVAFFGYDEISAEIFKALASTFIAAKKENGEISGRKISYTVFASGEDGERYRNTAYLKAVSALKKAKGNADYYEIPNSLADLKIRDADDSEAVKSLAEESTFVWAVVAHGDRERAQRVLYALEHTGTDCAVFYASDKNSSDGRLNAFDSSESCADFYMFVQRLACSRNLVYIAETAGKTEYLNALKNAEKKWRNAKPKIKRDSNLYAVLALRQILLSVGFDCAKNGKDEKATFDKLYDEKNPRVRDEDGNIIYDNATCECESLRLALAQREHLRWNEYMFACGVGPASRTEHRTVDKNELLLSGRHINATTWQGLADFRKDEAERRRTDEESTDVQRYDFQLADEATALLENNGFVIVRKKEEKR